MGMANGIGLLVRGEIAEVFGTGRTAIYDNSRLHKEGWYYWLVPAIGSTSPLASPWDRSSEE